ncbi:chloramphenicol acetyltransferase [Muricauda sp. SCSIO 64092]|uniref:chloramphenicol acetyltransferase n=1 Tax=Allomuricauda sp. SCSIO 64092 TaxID=2908842 RepID=UPI001FF5260C|nr:chloramphenicol acetyltransferase [Muricauda sp. SCSIO 64092]UOY06311.1 chloramphenicol acetyltransferase [Muricauda sp. SCSIO 64092]
MKKIVFENPHRKKHFEFFHGMNHPHFNLTANVDITTFLRWVKANNLPLTLTLVHELSKTANGIKEFRWRIRKDEVVEHELVHPSFTVPTDGTDVFSFCTVRYQPELNAFIQEANQVQQRMRTSPSVEDEPDRDDYLFMSAIPWVSFTGLQHAMSYHPHDSVPRISWGKFFEQNGRTLMPLSVQAHHGLVDGRYMGAYFNNFQEYLDSVKI